MMLLWCWRVVAVLVWAALVVMVLGRDVDTTDPRVVKQLEQHILAKFGLRYRPHIPEDVDVPPYMMELFHKRVQKEAEQEDEGQDTIPAYSLTPNIIRSLTHKESPADQMYPTHKMRLRFNISNLPAHEAIHTVELHVTHLRHSAIPEKKEKGASKPAIPTRWKKRKTSVDSPYLQRIMVYDVMRRGTKISEPALRLVDTRVVDARKPGAQNFDVTDSIRRWTQLPHSNNGLLVEVVPFIKDGPLDSSHVRLRRSVDDPHWQKHQPILVVHSHDGEAARQKRSVDKHRKTRQACRRHSLYVDFRKVGWDDWIVAPAGYDAYYCKGDCPFPLPDMLNATNHAVVQTLVNSRYPDRVPKACCVPTELSPISMLYMDDDERFVLKNHQNMVVEGCGCR